MDVQVDAIRERATEPRAIAFDVGRRALAVERRITEPSARARVGGADELEARWKGDSVCGAGDDHATVFERLPHGVEDVAWEFQQLVEEEDAAMRQTYFAGAWPGAAATETSGPAPPAKTGPDRPTT